MKKHLSVTISDLSGSHYFTIKNSTKRYLLGGLSAALFALLTLPAYIYLQHRQASDMYQRNDNLEHELTRFDAQNSLLIEKVGNYVKLTREIDRELAKIGRLGGLDSEHEHGNTPQQLAQRVQTLSQFYRAKEDEYSEIGERVEKIETVIGLQGKPLPATSDQLAARMDIAAKSARFEHVMHSSIPSGFPTRSRTITSQFGRRLHPVTKVNSMHNGIDLRAKTGAKVYAAANGIVRAADESKMSGKRVIIQHNYGFESYYAHLHDMEVQPGDIIYKGEPLGNAGNSGLSAAPHLHYEIRYLGKPVDPSKFLRWEFGSHEIFTQVKAIQWKSLVNLIDSQITQQTLQLSQLGPVLPEPSK